MVGLGGKGHVNVERCAPARVGDGDGSVSDGADTGGVRKGGGGGSDAARGAGRGVGAGRSAGCYERCSGQGSAAWSVQDAHACTLLLTIAGHKFSHLSLSSGVQRCQEAAGALACFFFFFFKEMLNSPFLAIYGLLAPWNLPRRHLLQCEGFQPPMFRKLPTSTLRSSSRFGRKGRVAPKKNKDTPNTICRNMIIELHWRLLH
jgi:hypothetical protein